MADDTTIQIDLVTVLKNLQNTLRGLDQLKTRLSQISNFSKGKTTNPLSGFDRATQSAQRLALAQRRIELSAARVALAQKNVATANLRAATSYDRAQLSAQRLDAQKRRLATGSVPILQRSLDKLGGSLNRVGSGLNSAGRALTVGLTAPLAALGIAATRNAVTLDSLRLGLQTVAGSAGQAAIQFERLRELAKLPGIGFQQAIQGSIRLQAVGFAAEDAEEKLRQFSNAVALTGGGPENLDQITVQLGQMASKSKVLAQDLKPIIEAAPAVGQALLAAFGTVDSEQIQKLGLSTEEFLDKLTKELTNLPRAAAGARNAFDNFTDSLFIASSTIGEAILPPLTRLITAAEPIILRLADAFKSLSPNVQLVAVAIGALAAVAGPLLLLLGGLVSTVGTIGTALGAVAGIVGSIGLPAIVALLAGLAAAMAVVTGAAVLLYKAWQSNFLGIREVVADAVSAVTENLQAAAAIAQQIINSVLPVLQQTTNRILSAVTEAWERYGKDIVKVVGGAFRFVSDVTLTFFRHFANFIDLVSKLISGDFDGAWRTFARIITNAVDAYRRLLGSLGTITKNAFLFLVKFITGQAVRFALAARKLGQTLVGNLVGAIILAAPKVRDALIDMFILAAAGLNTATIAKVIVDRLMASIRAAAASGFASGVSGGNIGAIVGGGQGKTPTKTRRRPLPPTDDKEGKKAARQLDDLRERLAEAQAEAALTRQENALKITRAGIEQQFEITRDGLERELSILEDGFEDRLLAAETYFRERERIQLASLEAEISREKRLSSSLVEELQIRQRAIEDESRRAIQAISQGPDTLKGEARIVALRTIEQKKITELAKAETEFLTQNAEVATRIKTLAAQRAEIARQTIRDTRLLTEELRKQADQFQFELDEEQGRTFDAEVGRLEAQFREAVKALRIDTTKLSQELQQAINSVNLASLREQFEALPEPLRILIDLFDILTQRAKIREQAAKAELVQTKLRLEEARIQDKVLAGVISQREAQAQIIQLQRVYKRELIDRLKGELAVAERLKDQAEIIRIQGELREAQKLGVAIDEVGRDLNRDLFDNLNQGFANVFSSARRGVEGVKDAFKDLGLSILDTFNRLAAESLVEKIFGSILKPDAENTEGTVGGFFSKLLGLNPTDDANTTATQENTEALNNLTETLGGTATEQNPVEKAKSNPLGFLRSAFGFLGGLFSSGEKEGEEEEAEPEEQGGGLLDLFTGGAGAVAAQQATNLLEGINILIDLLTEVRNAVLEIKNSLSESSGALSGQGGANFFSSLFGEGGGFAAGDFLPAKPGGRLVRVAEGGHDEAIVTTDPRYARRTLGILKEFFARTNNLFGSFAEGGWVPALAEGGIVSSQGILDSLNFSPRITRPPDSTLTSAGTRESKFRFVFTDERHVQDWLDSPEGEKVFQEKLVKHQSTIRKVTS